MKRRKFLGLSVLGLIGVKPLVGSVVDKKRIRWKVYTPGEIDQIQLEGQLSPSTFIDDRDELYVVVKHLDDPHKNWEGCRKLYQSWFHDLESGMVPKAWSNPFRYPAAMLCRSFQQHGLTMWGSKAMGGFLRSGYLVPKKLN